MEIFQVGGSVRDSVLGVKSNDLDYVVVGSTPEEMLALGFKQVGKDFPVFLDPETGCEHALARTERSTGAAHTDFEVKADPGVTLEEDLGRRDFTFNAMAKDLDGNLVDPYNGFDDILGSTIRHVSDAFADDPLRVLRAARFAAQFSQWEFEVAPETIALMSQMVRDGMLDSLTPERVWKETEKAMGCPGPRRYIEVLRDCGALAVVFPEIDALFGVPQPEKHHPEVDTGLHVLMVLDQAASLSADPAVRFAALVHDLGKGVTPEDQWPKHIGHEEAGIPLVQSLCDRYRVPKEFRDLGVITSAFHLRNHKTMEMRPKALLKTLELTDSFRKPERFEQFLLACEADARGREGLEHLPYPQAHRMRELHEVSASVSGRTVMREGLSGEEIGEAIRQERLRRISAQLRALTSQSNTSTPAGP